MDQGLWPGGFWEIGCGLGIKVEVGEANGCA